MTGLIRKTNTTVYFIKFLAIISVICAHCNSVTIDGFPRISSLILQNIGTYGVVCFFMVSGALFNSTGKDIKNFWLSKMTRIILPWIVSGTAIYLYVYLRKPPISIFSYVNYLIGNGSYLYYLSMLMLMYGIFYFISFARTTPSLIIFIAISLISSTWVYSPFGISPYINIFNWIGYFALGMLMNKYREKSDQVLQRIYKFRWIFYLLLIISMIFQIHRDNGGYYFNGINVIFTLIGALNLILISIRLSKIKESKLFNLLKDVGENTLFIYIWHMPIASITARLTNYSVLSYFTLVRPVLVLGIMLLAIYLARLLFKLLRIEKYLYVIGLKPKKNGA